MNCTNSEPVSKEELTDNLKYWNRVMWKDGYQGTCDNRMEENDRQRLKKAILKGKIPQKLLDPLLEEFAKGRVQRNVVKSCFRDEEDKRKYMNREIEKVKNMYF